jgi:lipoprotein-releasing system permease protein
VGRPESGPNDPPGRAKDGEIFPAALPPEGRDLPDILFPEHRAGNESLPSRALKEYPGIVVGKELARTLHVYVGDEVNVVSPSADLGPMGPIPKKRSFRVAAVFYTGMYEFDTKYAYVLLSVAQQFFNVGDAVTGLEARASDPALAPDVAVAIRERLAHWSAPAAATAAPEPAAFDPLAWEEAHGGVPATTAPVPGSNLVDTIGSHGADDSTAGGTLEVLDWQQMNRGLFSALRLEKTAMFVILTFIVLVAAFNIVSTLVMVVLEKGREIAILKSMGTSARGVVRIFVTQGLAIGLLGAAWGITIGYAGCVYMNTVGIQLDPDVYYISSLPVRTDLAEFAVVGLAAVAISVLATIYPAWQASRLNPIDGLRYE